MRDPVARMIYDLPPTLRTCVVLAGAVLIHLTIGTYHTFGNMLPYMASYMRNYTDADIRLEHLMWIPTFQGWLSLTLGPRTTTALGCFITTLSVALSSITIRHSFFMFFLTYGLMYGFGMGIAYVTAVSTVINWAPNKVGLISGIVAAGFGMSSSIFAPLQTKLVNPLNLPATSQGYFNDKQLLDRVPEVFLSLASIYAVMQFLGLIVLCDPPEEMKDEESLIRNRTISRESIDDDDFCASSESSDDDISMSPAQMFRSKSFYILFFALFCCSFYANMFYNLYKTFAETFIFDDHFLAVAFSVGSVVNAFARIGWGWLTDKISFQATVSVATCIAAALLFSMPITPIGGRYMYLAWLCGVFICMGATHALFIAATVRCFGTRYKASNYGLLTLSTTCSGILLAIVAQFFLNVIGYSWMFILTAAFPLCAFFTTSLCQLTPLIQRRTR